MKPLSRSSGDILADRRAAYAEILYASGDHAAAAEVMAGVLELTPDWALGWFRLGEMQEAAGAGECAVQAWRKVLTLDPDDHAGAALKLELLGEAPPSLAPPGAFIEMLFDQYAATFDQSLVGNLSYRVPQLLAQAIRECGEKRFARAVDLGCGTGLMGEMLRPVALELEGCDISGAMLNKARARGCYDRLTKSDIQSFDLPENSADLVTAADVFIYIGALERIFDKIAAALTPGGLFCFSVETHDGPEDFVLRHSRRYAHSRAFLLRLLAARGLSVASLTDAAIRQDRGESVSGMVVVARAGLLLADGIQAA